MSWWNAVVNTAQQVVNTVQEAARNVITEPGFPSGTGVCGVAQFQGPIYARPRRNDAIVADAVVLSDDDDEGTIQARARARITTRARITYELDRYQKNAMLIFVQIRNNLNEGRNEDSTNYDVSELVETFTSFRFEVDIQTGLTCSEVEHKAQEFFQRDFRQYGAVVVVVLSFEGTRGQLSARDGRFSESVILRHLTDDLNPTLLAKPKIYLTEANRTDGSVTIGRYSLSLEERHQDVLGIHIPSVYSETNGSRRPIVQLCHNMREIGDSRDFVSIVKKAVEEISESIPVFTNLPIELSDNFSKDMILARS